MAGRDSEVVVIAVSRSLHEQADTPDADIARSLSRCQLAWGQRDRLRRPLDVLRDERDADLITPPPGRIEAVVEIGDVVDEAHSGMFAVRAPEGLDAEEPGIAYVVLVVG